MGVPSIRAVIASTLRAYRRTSLFVPHMPGSRSYSLPRLRRGADPSSWAVPPEETWISEKYGATPAEYLASGQRDMQEMSGILDRAGVALASAGNILDFGCGDGRMIRWLAGLAPDREIWGTDIHAGRIAWCKQNLNPPFHFLVTTTVPHLPFEDRFFGLAFAGSVFTHIDDLADSWLAELRRVLRPGGALFMTVHLKGDIALLNGKHRASGLARRLRSHPEYREFSASDCDMFTIGRGADSYVFYDLDYLRRIVEPMFRIVSIVPEVRLYQHAVVMERR